MIWLRLIVRRSGGSWSAIYLRQKSYADPTFTLKDPGPPRAGDGVAQIANGVFTLTAIRRRRILQSRVGSPQACWRPYQ